MADIVDKDTRSRMMAGIRGKDTRPELALRRALRLRGIGYRLHAKGIIGRPDLVLKKYNAVVFVHGCFWHRHQGCRFASNPATRPEFWNEKFAANIARDHAACDALLSAGLRVAIIWECALRRSEQADVAVDRLVDWLRSDEAMLEVGETDVWKPGHS